jgi:tetratricopeptide (TPR) repeat protein
MTIPNSTIQNLENKLKQESASNKRVDILNDLSWECRYSNINQAKLYMEEAFRLSETLHYKFGFGRALLHKGLFCYMQSSGDEFMTNVQDALHIFIEEKQSTEQVKAYNILAGIYDNYGDYEKGIQVCRRGVEIATNHNLLSGKADCLTTLGQIYSRIGDFDLSIQQLEEGLNERIKLDEKMAICSSLNLIARIYLLKKNFQKSEEYYNKSLEYRTSINDLNGIPWTYLGLATLY